MDASSDNSKVIINVQQRAEVIQTKLDPVMEDTAKPPIPLQELTSFPGMGSFSKKRDRERLIVINADDENSKSHFHSNYIKTTKYTPWNFLFKCLFHQFKKFANIYFLLIAILQSIPIISPINSFTAIVPLVFVLMVSMIREGIEDFFRFKEDKTQNAQPVVVFQPKKMKQYKPSTKVRKVNSEGNTLREQYQLIESKDLKVGQVVIIEEEEVFPADLVILGTSNPDLICYVETSNLDGEKNLKKKLALESISNFSHKDMFMLHAELKCKPQTISLTDFDATLTNPAIGIEEALDEKQLLLKGSKLKNTNWVTGVVVYTGHETKIMINSQQGSFKTSQVEKLMHKLIVFILLVQSCLSLVLGSLSAWYQEDEIENHDYLEYDYDWYQVFFINFFSYFLLFNTLIPISLIVTLEIVKFIQILFIQSDVFMYHNDRFTKVSTFSINEELGQVKYIFSDKTGTLTANIMELKLLFIVDTVYGDKSILEVRNETEEDDNQTKLMTANSTIHKKMGLGDVTYSFQDDTIKQVLKNETHIPVQPYCVRSKSQREVLIYQTERERVLEFLKLLACCHECSTVFDKETKQIISYQGLSPDELALVESTREIGVIFLENVKGTISLKIMDKIVKIQLLNLFEFTSDRKRMSVIIRDEDGRIKVYSKGADSYIKDRLDPEQEDPQIRQKCEDFLLDASIQGFRTLMMGVRLLDEEEYNQWLEGYNAAAMDIHNKEARIEEEVKKIENDLVYLGCSAVEDQLQENVPNTIAVLRKANISIWMLTGDKLETAQNIGKSCRLITPDMAETTYILSSKDKAVIRAFLREKLNQTSTGLPQCLIVESSSIEPIMTEKEIRRSFIKLAQRCPAVILCRASPSQKADIVRAMKDSSKGDITLAIGDGANDVSMILEAHIGIGIFGKEGMRAAQTADFAIGEFQSLWNLLLIHGRLNYLRISEMIFYFFYKNLVFTLPHLGFAFWCGFSGQTFFDDWFMSYYNMIFTALPLAFKALLEHDIHHIRDSNINIRQIYPHLYHPGQYNSVFNIRNFILWMIQGAFHSAVILFIPIYVYQFCILDESGKNGDIWGVSVTSFTSIVFIVNLKLFNYQRFFNWIHIIGFIFLSIGLYLSYAWLSNYLSFSLTYCSIEQTFSSPLFYLTVGICICFPFLLDYFIKVYSFIIATDSNNYARKWAADSKKANYQIDDYNSNQKTHLIEISQREKRKLIDHPISLSCCPKKFERLLGIKFKK